MDRLRWLVVLIILAALAGGVLARLRYEDSTLAESQFEIRTPADSDDFHIAGSFVTPFDPLTGYRISLPRCPRPLAVLPVATATLVAPTAHRYGDQNSHAVSYIFNGNVYPEQAIEPRLRFLRMLYRFEALFGVGDAGGYAYFLKVWVPAECEGVSTAEAQALQRLLIGRVQPKP